ncbi:HER123Wp [Eremothecium sinecaudum]|uniref:dolichyl-phosphate beta-glucosyltransferase n=1 Tax=Eremothecium sinecaudum TaxID=45286 RepID=A0A0X8HTY2_9SACH|nr:HER123Wp [Eremothecium sinecaudum]AMD21402.1 HER123Wp [Eremothecium sinecaudum]
MMTTTAITFLLGSVSTLYLLLYLLSHTPRKSFDEELKFKSIDDDGKVVTGQLKNILDDKDDDKKGVDGDIELSVVVPSYNETARISVMLTETIEFLRKNYGNRWEIIVVDDGSQDGTAEFCLEFIRKNFKFVTHQFRVVKLLKNRGKGGAVRHGMIHVRGKYGLFADADGASKFSEVTKLIQALKDNNSKNGVIAIGSRAHMVNSEAVVKRSFIRNFLMYGLHMLVYLFGIRSVRDTQCGFKLFDKKAICNIFPNVHTEGWIFDVEVLLLGLKKGIPIIEIPISWHEVGGSKMVLSRDSIAMAKDLVVIRLAYLLHIYGDRVTY